MKTVGRVVLGTLLVIAAIVGGIYVDGAMLPVDHSTTVTGVVNAAPAKVFALITNVADSAAWRKQVKAVTVLPLDAGATAG